MNKEDIKIDKGTLTPEDFENYKTITLDDGSLETVYISRAGNIVTDPKDRTKNLDVTRQQGTWDSYIKSLRAGRPSAKQAALDNGYPENSAINIRANKWFKDRLKNLRRASIGGKAERNLSRGLDVQWSKIKLTEAGVSETVVDKDLFRTVMDVSKFIAGTLLKDEGYSTKTEVIGKMDGEIKINSISYAGDLKEVEDRIIDETIKQIEDVIINEVIK